MCVNIEFLSEAYGVSHVQKSTRNQADASLLIAEIYQFRTQSVTLRTLADV